MSKTVVFFGTDDFSAPTLKKLIETGYDVRIVVTKPDTKKGRGMKQSEPLVKTIAKEYGITVLQPERLADIIDDLKEIDDPIGVLVSYGKIIPQNIIDLFTPGIINVHPSALPKYRGSTPIESAILNGDEEVGVSIMQLSAKMDAGPVYTLAHIPLTGTETQPQLYEYLADIGAKEIERVLPAILDGSLQPIEQNEDDATYTKLLTKADSMIDPSVLTADEIERKVRAHLTYPKTKTTIADQLVILTKTHTENETSTKDLVLACKDGTKLVVDELIGPNGKTMSGQAFKNGYAAG